MDETEPILSSAPDQEPNQGEEGSGVDNSDDQKDRERHLTEVRKMAEAVRYGDYPLTDENYFVDYWRECMDEEDKTGRESELSHELHSLRGGTLIDLGSGKIDASFIPGIAKHYGAEKYIGVDRYYEGNDEFAFRRLMEFYHNDQTKLPQIEAVNEDGLMFLTQQPGNSASICINRLDETIMSYVESLAEGPAKRYVEALAIEIARVIGKDHMVFGYESPAIFMAMRRSKFFEESNIKGKSFSFFRLKSQ